MTFDPICGIVAVSDNIGEKDVIEGTIDSGKRVKEEMWGKQYF